MAEEPVTTVKLVSAEGHVFVVDKRAACVSKTISSMLSSPGGFAEQALGEVKFPEISTPVLEQVIKFMNYKWKLANSPGDTVPVFSVAPEVALQLLMAANYLDI